MKRRLFVKSSFVGGAVGAAVAAGLLIPTRALAAWPAKAFDAKEAGAATGAVFGSETATESADITIKAPDIAENGAVVPISIKTSIAGVESIVLVAAKNSSPMAAIFHLSDRSVADISTRIKLGKTSDVIAYVSAGGKLYSARKEVKVTIGGCGG